MVSKFSIRLKELREEKELSQAQLAKKVNIKQANISRWENKIQDPSIDYIIALAEFFGVTTDYLLGVTD